jgi:hypothetical protein
MDRPASLDAEYGVLQMQYRRNRLTIKDLQERWFDARESMTPKESHQLQKLLKYGFYEDAVIFLASFSPYGVLEFLTFKNGYFYPKDAYKDLKLLYTIIEVVSRPGNVLYKYYQYGLFSQLLYPVEVVTMQSPTYVSMGSFSPKRLQIQQVFYCGIKPVSIELFELVDEEIGLGFEENEDFWRFDHKKAILLSYAASVFFCNAFSRLQGITPYYVIKRIYNKGIYKAIEADENVESHGYRLPTAKEGKYLYSQRFRDSSDADYIEDLHTNDGFWTYPIIGEMHPYGASVSLIPFYFSHSANNGWGGGVYNEKRSTRILSEVRMVKNDPIL